MIADLHLHTAYSDGNAPLQAMKDKAIEYNLSVIGISDHALGWNEHNFFPTVEIYNRYLSELSQISGSSLRILKGLECDIGPDGQIITVKTIDFPKAREEGLDYAIASYHPEWNWWSGVDDSYRAVLAAIKNGCVDILGHPLSPLYGTSVNKEYLLMLCDGLSTENTKGHRIAFELNRKEYFRLVQEDKIDYLLFILDRILTDDVIPLSFGSDAHEAKSIGDHHFIYELEKQLHKQIHPRLEKWKP